MFAMDEQIDAEPERQHQHPDFEGNGHQHSIDNRHQLHNPSNPSNVDPSNHPSIHFVDAADNHLDVELFRSFIGAPGVFDM